jgi:hypothetical protein
MDHTALATACPAHVCFCACSCCRQACVCGGDAGRAAHLVLLPAGPVCTRPLPGAHWNALGSSWRGRTNLLSATLLHPAEPDSTLPTPGSLKHEMAVSDLAAFQHQYRCCPRRTGILHTWKRHQQSRCGDASWTGPLVCVLYEVRRPALEGSCTAMWHIAPTTLPHQTPAWVLTMALIPGGHLHVLLGTSESAKVLACAQGRVLGLCLQLA